MRIKEMAKPEFHRTQELPAGQTCTVNGDVHFTTLHSVRAPYPHFPVFSFPTLDFPLHHITQNPLGKMKFNLQ
jgi:hypothetical protein